MLSGSATHGRTFCRVRGLSVVKNSSWPGHAMDRVDNLGLIAARLRCKYMYIGKRVVYTRQALQAGA